MGRSGGARRLLSAVVVVLAVAVTVAQSSGPAGPSEPDGRAGSAVGVSGSVGPAESAEPIRPTPPAASAVLARGGSFSVLQLNLCNSGLAPCYANGLAVPEAASLIATTRPDAVTLDEICRHDLDQLAAKVLGTFPGDASYRRFQPVYDGSDAILRCRNGDQYGIGIVLRLPAASPGIHSRGGEYPVQDGVSGERRVWECLYAIGSRYVCATHLSADSRKVAMAQCRYLMNTAIPDARAMMGGFFPTVVGADLNLSFGGRPDVQDCVPAGWFRKGDGSVQDVLATGFTFVSTRTLSMRHTDHPGWLVTLRGR
jgi:hypothetical protein